MMEQFQNNQTIRNFIIKQTQSKVQNTISNIFEQSLNSAFDLKIRVKKDLDVELAENQIEIAESIYDHSIKNLNIIAARSGGKSFAAIVGATLISIDKTNNEPISIGITAPKGEQASRLISLFKSSILSRSSYIKSLVDSKSLTNTRVPFKNGSYWEAFSGSELANEEGRHYDILIVDEAQRVSDLAMSQILLPMIGHSKIGKIIKIGVPRYRGHFYKGFYNNQYINLSYDWTQCERLFRGGVVEIDGIKYPQFVLNRMPYQKWQNLFPKHVELWQEGDMSIEDFESQYELIWHLNINNLLNESDQIKLFGDFEFIHPQTEDYFFGLDLAGGELVSSGNCYTSLTIGRIRNGVKEVCDSYEWQGNVVDQMDEILSLIHPQTGIFKCKFGLGDYGEMGPAVIDMLTKTHQIPMIGIFFGAKDQASGKNMKNAMADHALFELRNDRFKFPKRTFVQKHKVLKKHVDQWLAMERKRTTGINDILDTPESIFNDGFWSSVLMIWCIDKIFSNNSISKIIKGYKFPNLIRGIPIVK